MGWPEDYRCDRCRFWLRDERGQPVYDGNRSQCLMEGSGRGFACTMPGATATTDDWYGCVLFQRRVNHGEKESGESVGGCAEETDSDSGD